MTLRSVPFLLVVFTLIHYHAFSQQTAIHEEPGATYRQAMELFSKQQYGAAKKLFAEVMESKQADGSEMYASAALHAAICASELFNPDAEIRLMTYIKRFPGHVGEKQAWFHLANHHYRDRNYTDAAGWFSKLTLRDVDPGRRDEFLFKKGYSLFMEESLMAAAQLFGQITDTNSAYFAPAKYYYGHIAYLQGHYETAMRAFQALADDRIFGPVVPYYIVHIYYLEGRYDDLLEHAPRLLEEASPRRAAEISKMIGEAYFQRSQYEQAIPYLDDFIRQNRGSASIDDHYKLGFALFMTGRYEASIPHLERATADKDSLAQNAYFHLASAYVESGQKRFARNAFMQAHQIGIDEDIARESLFNYALLSFELSYDPHNEAVLSFQRYVTEYPDSPRAEEALGYMVDLYLTTRNYREALVSLERIPLNTPRLREAFQRVSYYRGVELFNNGDMQGAIDHFEKTRRFTENRQLIAASLFWTGEAYYRQNKFENAIAKYEEFLVTPGAFSLREFNQANYSLAYAHFKLKNYGKAIPAFRKFIAATDEDPRMINDALLRTADSYFITKQYRLALDFYNRAINLGALDTDYAVFQIGLVHGIMGNFEQKIATMETLIRNYPRSSFIDDGLYEMANTWLILDNNARAKTYFGRLLEQHPNSSYAKSAMLKTGLIHFNENEDELALSTFRNVIEKFPRTPEAKEALAAIRNIYVGLDRVDEYVRFTERVGIADITVSQEDSLLYQAAENRYMQGDCSQAIQSFGNYLNRFPDGIFAINAQFYRAECLFRANAFQDALAGYQFVISRPRSKFLENALLRASGIHFSNGNYYEALQLYIQLEEMAEFRSNVLIAQKGQMRTLYHLKRLDEAMEAAEKVLESDRLSSDVRQEALLVKGLSALESQEMDTARVSLEEVVRIAENRRAAEAMYNLALITFREGDYGKAEEQIFDYVGKLSAYDYWLAKIFLLLADLYIETENYFQAKHTLESIIEHYEGEDLRKEAENRIEFINEQERMLQEHETDDEFEIELGEGDDR